jgi:(heptosyl)LPS beta-1,4-glucosyltransferase
VPLKINFNYNISAMKPHAAIPVSLCIVTNQANDQLLQLIDTCRPVVSEILVGYNGTEHAGLAAFQNLPGVKWIALNWTGYSSTKNNLAQLAENDWILSLDADEIPDKRLLQELELSGADGLPEDTLYGFRRQSFYAGKAVKYGAWGRDRVKRLYNRRFYYWLPEAVHEHLGSCGGATMYKELAGCLLHYTADNAATMKAKSKKYAELSAQKYFEKGRKSPGWKRVLAPLFTFIKEYLLQLGVLDGRAGLVIACINAQYTYWKYAFLAEKYRNQTA